MMKTGSNSKPLNRRTGSMNAATWTVSSELDNTRVKSDSMAHHRFATFQPEHGIIIVFSDELTTVSAQYYS